MSLPRDLLAQAKHLATLEPRRPKQASLRRAVSTAYYALFHLLVDEGSKLLAPTSPPSLKSAIARGFVHSEMKAVSNSFSSGAIPAHLPQVPITADLKAVARAFVKLQEARHQADYDTARAFSRNEVAIIIAQVDGAFVSLTRVLGSDAANVFLTALFASKKLHRP